jgi:hypothetical protein
MAKYKNVFLMIVAVILLGYAAFISIIPSMMSKNFNIDKFEQATLKAAGLNVTFEMIDYKIKPNLKTIIIIRDLVAMYPDQQPLFSAKYIELETTPAAIFKKDFDIKSLYLKHVKYEDQILPNGVNKLAYLPESFDPSYYGAKKVTIRPNSQIRIKNLERINTITNPYSYRKYAEREAIYTQSEVSIFLHSLNFKNVNIK